MRCSRVRSHKATDALSQGLSEALETIGHQAAVAITVVLGRKYFHIFIYFSQMDNNSICKTFNSFEMMQLSYFHEVSDIYD